MAALAATPALVLGACTSQHNAVPGGQSPAAHTQSATSAAPSTATSTAPAPLARLVAHPANGTHGVSPADPITVTVADGTLTSVTMTNDEGKVVKGAISADQHSWAGGEDLGYGKAYTVKAKAVNADGKPVARTSSFTTVTPDNMTMPYLNTTAGTTIKAGATYGVGMVISVHFDEAISNKAAAEKHLKVTSSPSQPGSWYWLDDQNAHFRPQQYWKSGTKVSVAADVYGVQMAPGMYGQADVTTSFKIGARHVSIADDKTHMVKVYKNGTLIKKMPTSMGKGGSEVSNGQTITFWTQRGTYTVLDQGNPVRMDSRSFGLALDAGGYNVLVYWATRISTDGIYVHSAPWSVWAQGKQNTSHGCLNVSPANAEWFYKWSQPGDIVQVKNTGGAPLEVWQNGDWGLSWSKWKAGSALN